MAENEPSAKICPFMSGPGPRSDPMEGEYTHHAECITDRCRAWIEPCDIFQEDIHEQGKVRVRVEEIAASGSGSGRGRE